MGVPEGQKVGEPHRLHRYGRRVFKHRRRSGMGEDQQIVHLARRLGAREDGGRIPVDPCLARDKGAGECKETI